MSFLNCDLHSLTLPQIMSLLQTTDDTGKSGIRTKLSAEPVGGGDGVTCGDISFYQGDPSDVLKKWIVKNIVDDGNGKAALNFSVAP